MTILRGALMVAAYALFCAFIVTVLLHDEGMIDWPFIGGARFPLPPH